MPGRSRYARRLAWARGVIIGVIALLAIVGQVVIQDGLARQAEAGALATLAHAHRRPTRVVSDAALALVAETDPARRLPLARALGDHIATWERQHAALGSGENDVISAAEWVRVQSLLMGATPEFRAIDRAARDVAGAVAPDGRLVEPAAVADRAAVIERSEPAYLAGLAPPA